MMEINLRTLKGLEKLGAVLCLIGILLIFPCYLALFALAHPEGAAQLLKAVLKMSWVILIVGAVLIGWVHFKKNK